jgi:hypothetical protein
MKKTMTGRQWRGRSMTSGGRRRTASVTARFFEEGEAPGHRVLVQTARATKEDEEAPRECFTGDEAPGRPAMARRRDPPGGGTYTKVERCGACTGAEKGARKARACLYRLGRRRGSGVRANWPSMAMAAAGCLQAIKGGRLIRENRLEN